MNHKELVEKVKNYQPDPKTLLTALILQLGGKVVIDYDHLLKACNYDGACLMEDKKEGIVVTIEPVVAKSPLDDDDMLDRLIRSPHVSRA